MKVIIILHSLHQILRLIIMTKVVIALWMFFIEM